MKPLTAEKDIHVFKVVVLKGPLFGLGYVGIPYYYNDKGVIYEKGKKYTSKIFYEEEAMIINEGLHSYLPEMTDLFVRDETLWLDVLLEVVGNSGEITNYQGFGGLELGVMECVIPVGATYFLNENGEVVSNRLRVTRINKIDELETDKCTGAVTFKKT